MNPSRILAAALLLACGAPAFAQEKLPDGANVVKLDVRPAKVEITGPLGYTQLLVTATLDNGETADVTRIVTYELPKGLTQSAGLVRATADASGEVRIT